MRRLGINFATEADGPGDVVEYAAPTERAGFDHVSRHQTGPNRAEFIEFAEREIVPGVS